MRINYSEDMGLNQEAILGQASWEADSKTTNCQQEGYPRVLSGATEVGMGRRGSEVLRLEWREK